MGKLELKINVRHTDNGRPKIRTVTLFNNFTFGQRFNALADTFSFDFYFDPKDQNIAETMCVSHMHECQIYYNGGLQLTGYILRQSFKDTGKAELATISGYSKTGALNDCDSPVSESTETNGLSLKDIIKKFIKPFNLKLVIEPSAAKGINSIFNNLDKDEEKASPDTSQNLGSYLSELAKQKGIVLSHNESADVLVKKPNTNGTPIFNFDFTSDDPNNDAKKIPVIDCSLEFNGQGMHTSITVIQQADDEEGTNASGPETRKNPLIPIGKNTLNRPRNIVMSSGNQFTVGQCCDYELGKEIRDNVILKIKLGVASINDFLIRPDNTLTILNPNVFLYTKSKWFIESVDTEITPQSETCTLNCVLPFGYDFIYANLKNVFVDAHNHLPRFK